MPKRLLIVDDDALLLRALVRSLKGHLPEWEILQADQSAVAVYIASRQDYSPERFEAPRIDVVISDYQMPGYNGLDVLSEFAKHAPSTFRIMTSGMSIDEISNEDERAETVVDIYLPKPTDVGRLVRILEKEEPGDD